MIGIFDSGIGGLSVLKEVRKALPYADIVYYADNAYCPYGPKSREFVQKRAEAITQTLVGKYGADIIVIACNTATAAAINYLREKYSETPNELVSRLTSGKRDKIMFIGMEPAIKPASEHTKTGVIGVLATAGTLRGQKYTDMREQYCRNVRIIEHVGENFVEMVEKGMTSGPEVESTVIKSIRPMIEAGADTIVLGCTHYPFLAETILKAASSLGHKISVINPAPAVTKHLSYVMAAEGIPTNEGRNDKNILGKTILLASGDDKELKKAFASLL